MSGVVELSVCIYLILIQQPFKSHAVTLSTFSRHMYLAQTAGCTRCMLPARLIRYIYTYINKKLIKYKTTLTIKNKNTRTDKLKYNKNSYIKVCKSSVSWKWLVIYCIDTISASEVFHKKACYQNMNAKKH